MKKKKPSNGWHWLFSIVLLIIFWFGGIRLGFLMNYPCAASIESNFYLLDMDTNNINRQNCI